jgi:hypothetical protein
MLTNAHENITSMNSSEAGRYVEATITYSSFAVQHRHLLGSAVFAEDLSRDISISNIGIESSHSSSQSIQSEFWP